MTITSWILGLGLGLGLNQGPLTPPLDKKNQSYEYIP